MHMHYDIQEHYGISKATQGGINIDMEKVEGTMMNNLGANIGGLEIGLG